MAIETLMHNTDPLGALLGDASDIIFDNGGTSYESTDVEGALKEVYSAIPNVVDNLTSTSSTDALSAKQGKVLNDTKVNTSDFLASNLPNGIQTGNIGYGSIINYVKNTLNGKTGTFLVYTQNAPDSKESGTVSVAMIIKPTAGADYVQILEFYGSGIFAAGMMSSSTSLSWTKLTV